MTSTTQTVEFLRGRLGDPEVSEFRGQTRVAVPKEHLFETLRGLYQQRHFDLLVDISCVDYLHYREDRPARFGLVYLLSNTDSNERVTLRVFVDEPEDDHASWGVPSAVSLWEGANWLEREVYDLFGIVFDGHPDLRRIVLPPEFNAHPLRKDYPLQGLGERHNFPVITREQS